MKGIPALLDLQHVADDTPGAIASNVRRVVFYTSRSYDGSIRVVPTADNLADADGTALRVQDVSAAEDLGLPAYVTERIETEIAADLQRVKALAPSPVAAGSYRR